MGFWDRFLTSLTMSVNSVPNATTKLCPQQVLFGGDVRTPIDNIMRAYVPCDALSYFSPSEIMQKRERTFAIVRNNIKSSFPAQEKAYNAKHRPSDLKLGQLVKAKTFYLSNAPLGYNARLDTVYSGPFVLVGYDSDSVCLLQNQNHSLILPLRVHLCHLEHWQTPKALQRKVHVTSEKESINVVPKSTFSETVTLQSPRKVEFSEIQTNIQKSDDLLGDWNTDQSLPIAKPVLPPSLSSDTIPTNFFETTISDPSSVAPQSVAEQPQTHPPSIFFDPLNPEATNIRPRRNVNRPVKYTK